MLPTAHSILSAARANVETKGEVTQDLPTDTSRGTDIQGTDCQGTDCGTSDTDRSIVKRDSTYRIQACSPSAEDARTDVMQQSTSLSHSLISLDNTASPTESVLSSSPAVSRIVQEDLTSSQAVQPLLIPGERLTIATDPRLEPASDSGQDTTRQDTSRRDATRSDSSETPPALIPDTLIPNTTPSLAHATSSMLQPALSSSSLPTITTPYSRVYRNSGLWTITCNHPGYRPGYHPESDVNLFDDERAPKKRRLIAEESARPRRITKILLLGGCNSTMSTVRTIFRHIQPFSVVTGVTVVRDNLSLSVNPANKRDSEDWEDSGYLAQLCYGSAATTVGTQAYVFGGKDANSQYLAEFQEFDMVKNTCRVLPKGPQPKENAVAVRIGLIFI